MSKVINSVLLAHEAQECTTLCYALKIVCVGRWEGHVFGFTTLNANFKYDDLTTDGEISYSADDGFAPDKLQASSDMSVDNTELHGWVSEVGATMQQIRAGIFDRCQVTIYRINYMDLTPGRHEILATGEGGETQYDEYDWKLEFRSLTQQLKEPVAELYDVLCRNDFGDSFCAKPFVWNSGNTISHVGVDEPDRVFTATSLGVADGFYFPAVVRWLTGDNAGQESDVDSQVGNVIALTLSLPYAVNISDTFDIRQDCDFTFAMCRDRHNNVLNNNSEHLTPIQDGGASLIPGAELA